MPHLRRGTLLSFRASDWTALVFLDGADAESQIPVGEWVQSSMLAGGDEVAVLIFGDTNTDDGLVLGPYGGLGLQDLDSAATPSFGALNLGAAAGAVLGELAATPSDAATNSVPNIILLGHNTSATPAVGFGLAQLSRLQTTTTLDTLAAYDQLVWVDPTHASRKARRAWSIYDTAQREGLRIEASGSAPMIGFLGAGAQARPTAYTQTYATASRTHSNPTASAPPAGGAGATAGAYDTAAHRDALIASVTALIADVANIKQVLNAIIDDLQANGLLAEENPMPAFNRPAPAAITDFSLRLVVRDDAGVTAGGAPAVDLLFSAIVVDASGAPLARPGGDLRPYLSSQQQTQFEEAALALYAKAKADLLS